MDESNKDDPDPIERDDERSTTEFDVVAVQESDTLTSAPSLEQRIRDRIDSYEAKVKVDPLIGTLVVGRYEIESKLGVGGMGAVYKARQIGMGRKVAIKVLHKEYATDDQVRRRFHIEALAVSRLAHPNTIRIFDFGDSEEVGLFIVMEFLDGRPLDVILDTEGAMSVRRTLRLMVAISASLQEAHQENIVHRDLKPDNLFLVQVEDNPDFVKVLDFGVAKLITDKNQGKAGTLTLAGSIFGTPRYMAPEQCRSLGTDGRTDVYALGVIMYQCLTGVLPFDEDNPLTIMMMHLQQPPDPFIIRRPSIEIPAEAEAIVMRSMAKDPEERFASAHAMKVALEEVLGGMDARFEDLQLRTDDEIGNLDLSQSVTRMELPLSPTTRARPGQREPAPSKRRGLRLAFVLGVIVVAGSALAGILYMATGKVLQAGEPRLDAVVTQVDRLTKVAPNPPNRVTVLSTPSGANVLVDGTILGQTPLELERNPGQSVKFGLSAPGHLPVSGEEDFAVTRARTFTLQPQRAFETKAAGPTSKSKARPSSKSKTRTPTKGKPDYRPTRLKDFKSLPK